MIGNADHPWRLAVVLSHPTQYYSPWFRHLADRWGLDLKVFYLWDFGVRETVDRTFGTRFTWDIPLLEGYQYEFLPNRSADPGTHHFRGLDNPTVVGAIAGWEPDAVLVFGYNYATHLRLIFSRRLRRVPFLFRGDSHDLHRTASWKQGVGKVVRLLVFRRFSAFLAVGEANARYFRNNGVSEDKIERAPHCVDNERFLAAAPSAARAAGGWKRELGIPDDATVILFAGKFERKKRPLDLLRAFMELREQLSDTSGQTSGAPTSDLRSLLPILLFVGSGPLESELRDQAGAEIGRGVFFAPFQNQTEMPKVYATGDVMVLPSYGGGETWGLAVNEAMNLARPVIVSTHVGCAQDLVIEGETGWVFPAGDISALRDLLKTAIASPECLREMGKAARIHVAGYSYGAATAGLLRALGAVGACAAAKL